MSYIAERRQEEKERRRAEILDAAEAVCAEVGWDAMTMDQVARKARLSRALLYVLGPVAASFVHLLLSPRREFEADRLAAALCESPHGLADALLRLEQASELVSFQASPATEPLYTINPLAEEGLAKLFVTHPPVGERVRRLRELDPDWREKLRAA